MDRITFDGNFCDIAKCDENPCKYPDGVCSQKRVWERLKAFEDAEEQGRLVVLPCKVGDKLWYVHYVNKCDICPYNRLNMCKYDGRNVECPDSIYEVMEDICAPSHLCIDEDGNTKLMRGLYLTREAAEAALREMEKDNG